jgi:hypothetical protein
MAAKGILQWVKLPSSLFLYLVTEQSDHSGEEQGASRRLCFEPLKHPSTTVGMLG